LPGGKGGTKAKIRGEGCGKKRRSKKMGGKGVHIGLLSPKKKILDPAQSIGKGELPNSKKGGRRVAFEKKAK